ncbi:Uncharacterized protein SCF082_LOCUS49023 [Durusdinium trenchii]|uniref:Uncharacterized protein n=1 Tax=Durusdinium trenchii TaxID=1381693 RepID=A0ABP0RZ89_9DINO
MVAAAALKAAVLAMAVAVAHGDFLEEYLNLKTFGPFPGPCNPEECEGDFNNLPQSIKDIRVCLLSDNDPDSCDKLGELVQGGTYEIWDLSCKEISVEQITFVRNPFTGRRLPGVLDVDGLRLDCTFMANIERLVLELFGFFKITLSIGNGDFQFEQTASDPGTFLRSQGNFVWNNAADYLTEIPEYVEFPADQCDIQPNLGMDLDLPPEQLKYLELCFGFLGCARQSNLIWGIIFRLFNWEAILNGLADILEGLIGGIICATIEQGAWLNSPERAGTDVPGLLNELWFEFAADFNEAATKTADDLRLEDSDAQQLFRYGSYLNQTMLDNALDFSNSTVAELISVTANNFLGVESTDNPGNLVVNEIVALLSSPNPPGYFDTGSLVADDLSTFVEADVADVTVRLDYATVFGLDTFTVFRILQNGYGDNTGGATFFDPYRRTFNNTLHLDSLGFQFEVYVRLDPGEWVLEDCTNFGANACAPRNDASSEFTFTFYTELKNVEAEVAFAAVFNDDELNPLKVGQLLTPDALGTSLDAYWFWIRHCIGKSFYSLRFTSIDLLINQIVDPTLVNFEGPKLNLLVDGVIDYVVDATRGAVADKIDGISQGIIRDYLNEVIADRLVATGLDRGLTLCPAYRPDFSRPDRIDVDFDDGIGTYAFPVINDALGGNPVPDTDTTINEVIDVLLKFYEVSIPDFPLDSWDNVTGPEPIRFPKGYWELKDEYQDAAVLPQFNSGGVNFMSFTTIYVDNVNGIYNLTAESVPEEEVFDRGLRTTLGIGGQLGETPPGTGLNPVSPLTFGFTFSVFTTAPDIIDEVWEVKFLLEELDFEFITNNVVFSESRMYNLFYGQIDHIPCLIQTLDKILFPGDFRSTTLENLNFEIEPVTSSPGNSHPIVQALYGVRNSPSDNKTAKRFKGLINSAAQGTMDRILDTIEDLPETYKEERINQVTCTAEDDPFVGTFNSAATLSLPNFTYFNEVCLGPLRTSVDPPNVVEFNQVVGLADVDVVDVFDFRDSFLLDTLQDLASDGDTLDSIFIALANSTGNVFSDFFVLDENDPTLVDLNFPLSSIGLRFEDDSIVDGLIVDAGDLYVKGINRLVQDTYELFKPVGRLTTRNFLRFNTSLPLDVTVNSTILIPCDKVDEVGPGAECPPSGIIEENIVSTLNIRGLSVQFDLVLGINENLFGGLTLGQLLSVDSSQAFFPSDYFTPCFFSTLLEGGHYLSYLDVEITELDGPSVNALTNEFLSPAIEELVEAVVELAKDFYLEAIPNICDNCLREFFNDVMRTNWEEAQVEGACPKVEDLPPPPLSGSDVIYRFNEAPDFLLLQELFQEYVAADNFATLNTVAEATLAQGTFLKEEDENIFFPDIPLIYDGFNYGSLGFAFENLRFVPIDKGLGAGPEGGLGTFTEGRFFEPYYLEDGSTRVISRRELPTANISAPGNLIAPENLPYTTMTSFFHLGPVGARFLLDLNFTDVFPEKPNMKNQLEVTLELEQIDFALMSMQKINITKAMNVRFSSISTLEELPCALVPFESLEPLSFLLTTANLNINIECLGITCDLFPGLEFGGSINTAQGNRLSDLVNDFLVFFTAYIETQGLQTAVDAFLSTAPQNCARLLGLIEDATDVPRFFGENIAATFGLIFLGGAGLGGAFTVMLFPTHKNRRKQVMAVALKRHKDVLNEEELAGIMAMTELTMRSTFAHPITPNAARYIVPIVCVGNVVGLVIAIVFSDAANIVIAFTVLGNQSRYIDLVPFTIVSTINDMWNSGAWPLAVLIAVASCAWPVVKNLLLLAFWFMPKTIMSSKKQRAWLELMDLLGKWSFLDVYVIVIMLAALRTYVQASYFGVGEFLSDDFFVADVNVTPETGIILLCFVASMSLVINHIIIFYHDRVTKSNAISEDKINGNYYGKMPQRAAMRRKINEHVFVGKNAQGMARMVSPKGNKVVLLMAFLSTVCICIGVFLPMVTFEFNGLVGILLEYIEETSSNPDEFLAQLSTKTYSIMDMGTNLAASPTDGFGGDIVLIFFQLLYFITVLIAPLLCIVLTLLLWTRPLSLDGAKSFHFFAKLAFYWSAIEVFIVGIIATIIEIRPVTAFIVDFITNDVCGYIRAIIAVAVPDEKDAFCLDVIGSFEPTVGVLFAGVVLQLCFFWVVTVVGRAVIDDRYFAAYHELRSDVKPRRLGRFSRMTIRYFTVVFPITEDNGEGFGAFYDLDNDNNRQIEVQETTCSRLTDWCCSTEKGQQAADERIRAWQAKFGVVQTGPLQRVSSDNPAFQDPPPETLTMPSPPAPGKKPKKVKEKKVKKDKVKPKGGAAAAYAYNVPQVSPQVDEDEDVGAPSSVPQQSPQHLSRAGSRVRAESDDSVEV